MFDSMQDQDDGDDDGEGADLQGSTEFVLDDCPFGAGVMILVKSMRMGEVCEAWLGPQHVPGEGFGQQQKNPTRAWPRQMLSTSLSCLIMNAGYDKEVLSCSCIPTSRPHTHRVQRLHF